ncbi:MAG: hypothetical protein QGG05_10710 [Candidatus Latescibacteria bacterium]|nr:hypothetical protein [Candidatus Latescibacterota bacterium]MEE3043551.1 hypothetical protein [Candidatus Latescibacterota bacterium]MEE3263764.1 hypothetical protein [Candidatus Latescibacterota bacterium]
MQIICEAGPRIAGLSDGARFVSHIPHFDDEPVVVGDTFVDGYGCSIYGSVLQEGSRFRMWCQTWPRDYDGTDSLLVGCLESEDGLHWTKPSYGLIERSGSTANHLTNLPFHAPSVFVDPHAVADQRYRGFGYLHPERATGFSNIQVPGMGQTPGYYTAYSADGINWTVEPDPLWDSADVIAAAWDPWFSDAGAARIALKRNGLSAGLFRRRFLTSEWCQGAATPEVSAFVADESDDQAARAHGCLSADYYGVSWLPTPGPTVAMVWMFRHIPPMGRSADRLWNYGSLGQVDLELRYQPERGGRWLSLPGKPDWVNAAQAPEWARGCLYGASHAIHVGDETWLYVTGTTELHGYTGSSVDRQSYRDDQATAGGFARIGRLTWPRHRILGVRARLQEQVDLLSGPVTADEPAGLFLNAHTGTGGRLRAALLDAKYQPIPGYGVDDCDAISGDHLNRVVSWNGSPQLPETSDRLIARMELTDADLWAFTFGI